MKRLFALALVLSWYPSFSQSTSGLVAMDALQWTPKSIFPLVGNCQFFDGQLLTPEECRSASGSVITFPQLWADKGNGMPGMGVATYSISVLLPHEHPADLALALPQMYSSYKLWANGIAIAQNGTVGALEVQSTPQWMPQTVDFKSTSDTLNIVLQIAN